MHTRAPTKVEALTKNRRRVEHGLLTIGLKLHDLGDGTEFYKLVLDALGKQPTTFAYRLVDSSFCLVLPPVGNARSAIQLLECIEAFTGVPIFGNKRVQLQVCSPGRLNARRSAMLAIAFYMGSDTIRRYSMTDLETTFSRDDQNPRGKRLVLYDAPGNSIFERSYDWWSVDGGRLRVDPKLPFKSGRSDILVGTGSRLDIENINLLATLLVHVEHHAYWYELGRLFETDMVSMLRRHELIGLLAHPWVRTDDTSTHDDNDFFAALQELVKYAFDEWERLTRDPGIKETSILWEMDSLIKKYRALLIRQSLSIDKGGMLT